MALYNYEPKASFLQNPLLSRADPLAQVRNDNAVVGLDEQEKDQSKADCGSTVQTMKAHSVRDQALRKKLAKRRPAEQSQKKSSGSSTLATMASTWATTSTNSKAKADSDKAGDPAALEEEQKDRNS